MISMKPVIAGLLISFLYLPFRHVYSILSFHLSPLPKPFSDPGFISTSSLSPLRQVRTTTIFSNSNQTISFDQSNYDRFAFCEDAIVYKLEGGEREVGILSCDPTRWGWNTVMGTLVNPRAGKGALWVLDPVKGGDEVKRIKLDWNENPSLEQDFHPLGIDIYPCSIPGGSDTLFVINHRAEESTVEVFNLSCSASLDCVASHLRSLSHPSFSGAPNSIAAVSPTSFYLSHDHRFNLRTSSRLKKLLNSFETLLALPLSYVDFVTFTSPSISSVSSTEIAVSRAMSRIAFANGIVLSSSGKTLAVASTTARSVFLYSRNLVTNTLSSKPYRIIKLPFLVDNLSVSPFKFLNKQNGSPSAVAKNPERSSDKVQVSEKEEEDRFELIATGHPSFFHLLATAHQSPPFSLSSLLSTPLNHLPLPESFKELVKSKLKVWFRNWEFDWKETRGLSWSVSISNPPSQSSEKVWESLFMSSGKKREEGGYGSSSTTILGESLIGRGEGEKRKRWMIVVGLYEEGTKVVVEE